MPEITFQRIADINIAKLLQDFAGHDAVIIWSQDDGRGVLCLAKDFLAEFVGRKAPHIENQLVSLQWGRSRIAIRLESNSLVFYTPSNAREVNDEGPSELDNWRFEPLTELRRCVEDVREAQRFREELRLRVWSIGHETVSSDDDTPF